MRNTIIGLVYLIVVLICVIVSGYTTYVGSLSMFGGAILAAMFAGLVALCLFGADLTIRSDLIVGRAPLLPVGFLLAAIAVSSMSHFNFFFTQFEGPEIARSAFRQEFGRFEQNMVKARSRVEHEESYAQHARLRAYVRGEGVKLRDQMLDPANKGVGEEALVYVNNIRRVLGASLTDINLPAATERRDPVLIAWYDNFMRVALAAVDLRTSEPVRNADVLLDQIEDKRREFAAFLVRINDPEDQVSRQAVTQQIQAMSDYSSQVETALLAAGRRDLGFEPIGTGTSRTGEIVFSLSRVGDGQGLGVALLAIAWSLFIDLAPLGFAVALTRGGASRVGPSGRSFGQNAGPRPFRR